MSIFADRLKECRKKVNKTQREVAINLGLTENGYKNYELGYREPNHETTVKIANYFEVSVDYLLGCSHKPKCQHLCDTSIVSIKS